MTSEDTLSAAASAHVAMSSMAMVVNFPQSMTTEAPAASDI
jgi:hypothetical protein